MQIRIKNFPRTFISVAQRRWGLMEVKGYKVLVWKDEQGRGFEQKKVFTEALESWKNKTEIFNF